MSNMDFSVSEAAVSLEWYIVESGVFVRPLTKVIIYKSRGEPFLWNRIWYLDWWNMGKIDKKIEFLYFEASALKSWST
jgi:hypothetical protein